MFRVGGEVFVPWTATKGVTIVAAENIDIANFFKVGSHTAKKIFGSQNHFWQLAQAKLVEFIPDTKSLAAKTNFGRILPNTQHNFPPKTNAITADHLDKALGKS